MIIKFIIFIFIFFLLNNFLRKKELLIDKIETSKHKSKVLTSKKTPLTGGLILITFLFFTPIVQEVYFLISIILIYILGLLSDLNILTSPLKRIFFQSLIILSFILIGNLEVRTISIDFMDNLLKAEFFNMFFILLCLLVLINGSNFIDGLNTLVVNYFLMSLFAIYISSHYYNFQLDNYLFKNIIIILLIISIFNLLGKSFLGDSGTYSLAFLVGVLCIKFIYNNPQVVSPYFIALLLWYPAIENLFSIIRRTYSKKRLSNADNLHLHHLIYLFFKKKIFFKNKIITNSLSAIIINFYNFLSIVLSILYISNSKILIMILFFNTTSYLLVYSLLKKLDIK